MFPDREVLKSLKVVHHAEELSDEEFVNSEFIRSETKKLIEAVNQHVNKCEQLQNFCYILTPLTVESGDLTPTLKIRREVVAKKYHEQIDLMYKEEGDA